MPISPDSVILSNCTAVAIRPTMVANTMALRDRILYPTRTYLTPTSARKSGSEMRLPTTGRYRERDPSLPSESEDWEASVDW